jgi:hypothetical protein
MIESLFVTLLPTGFLIVLFGGGALLRRNNINMDGNPPIAKVGLPIFLPDEPYRLPPDSLVQTTSRA